MKFNDHFCKEQTNDIVVSEKLIPQIIYPLVDESFMDDGNIYYLIIE